MHEVAERSADMIMLYMEVYMCVYNAGGRKVCNRVERSIIGIVSGIGVIVYNVEYEVYIGLVYM